MHSWPFSSYGFRSRGVAVVTAKVSFIPDKISILSKPCRYSGRQVSCFKAKVCFSATFKPANPLGPAGNVTDSDLGRIFFRRWDTFGFRKWCILTFFIKTDIKYNLTLDADLQSSRVSPRGHFSNLDRVVQKDISVSVQDICEEHDVYVLETPDLVNSIALRVDVVLSHPDANPVLDVFSPTAWEFFVSVARSVFLCFKCLWFTVKDMC